MRELEAYTPSGLGPPGTLSCHSGPPSFPAQSYDLTPVCTSLRSLQGKAEGSISNSYPQEMGSLTLQALCNLSPAAREPEGCRLHQQAGWISDSITLLPLK